MKDIGEAIRKRREELGWTQQWAAERTGMSVGGYARIERGQRAPTLSSFLDICRGLGCSPDELLSWDGYQQDVAQLNELTRQLSALDEEALEVVAGLVQYLIQHAANR